MNNFFQRLDLDFPAYHLDDLKGDFASSYVHPDNGEGILHYRIKSKEVENDIRKICEGIGATDPYILYSEITITRLWLHRDVGGTVAINHYIETPPTKTTFYTANKGYKGIPVGSHNQTIYQREFCKEECCFVAKPKSTWMLNVSEIHNVEKNGQGIRKMISVSFPQTDYETLAQKLKYLYD